MDTQEQAAQDARSKRTRMLLAGGAVSLALPLLGVLYLRLSESKTARPPDASVTFDRREKGEEKVNVSQNIAMPSQAVQVGPGPSSLPVAGGMTVSPAPGSGSSLDFVKGGANNTYYQDKPAAPAASTAPAVAAAAAAPPPEPAPAVKVAAKGGKKPFMMPKLNGTKSFSSFKGTTPAGKPGAGAAAAGDPQAGGANVADMLKNVPGANNNPDLQKYLKK